MEIVSDILRDPTTICSADGPPPHAWHREERLRYIFSSLSRSDGEGDRTTEQSEGDAVVGAIL